MFPGDARDNKHDSCVTGSIHTPIMSLLACLRVSHKRDTSRKRLVVIFRVAITCSGHDTDGVKLTDILRLSRCLPSGKDAPPRGMTSGIERTTMAWRKATPKLGPPLLKACYFSLALQTCRYLPSASFLTSTYSFLQHPLSLQPLLIF
jgi:hypothetical protein